MTIMKMNKLCKATNTVTFKPKHFEALAAPLSRSPNDNDRRGGRSLTELR